jgi:hypothetical protein
MLRNPRTNADQCLRWVTRRHPDRSAHIRFGLKSGYHRLFLRSLNWDFTVVGQALP